MGKGISVMRTLTATVYQMRTTIVHSGWIHIRSSRALKTILEEEENLPEPGGRGEVERFYGHVPLQCLYRGVAVLLPGWVIWK